MLWPMAATLYTVNATQHRVPAIDFCLFPSYIGKQEKGERKTTSRKNAKEEKVMGWRLKTKNGK